MYPGTPLRIENGRGVLRIFEILAGFWWGLHPYLRGN